jgi:hypothetical protein
MTLTIDHPGRRRNIPLLPALIGLAMTALVMAVAFQLSGAFVNNDPAPTAPAIEVPAINPGPNADLAPDLFSQQAASAAIVGDSVNRGPNVGLPLDSAINSVRVVTHSAQGPNVGLAPDWATRRAATVGQD